MIYLTLEYNNDGFLTVVHFGYATGDMITPCVSAQSSEDFEFLSEWQPPAHYEWIDLAKVASAFHHIHTTGVEFDKESANQTVLFQMAFGERGFGLAPEYQNENTSPFIGEGFCRPDFLFDEKYSLFRFDEKDDERFAPLLKGGGEVSWKLCGYSNKEIAAYFGNGVGIRLKMDENVAGHSWSLTCGRLWINKKGFAQDKNPEEAAEMALKLCREEAKSTYDSLRHPIWE
jgi:hypothetical protein